MNTTDRRIKKVLPALSARERVALAWEERKARGIEDPLLGATMPDDQYAECRRLWVDIGIVNHELGGVILALHEATTAQEWRWRWFEVLAAHATDLALVGEVLKIPGPAPRLRPPIDPDGPVSDDHFAGRAPGVLKGLRDAVVEIAGQAYATEQIFEEFSGELEGGDPLRPQARALLEKTKERLDVLFENIEEWIGPVARSEHIDEYLGCARTIVEGARKR
jgi:hypothetical protein